jgi:hypothetical protein
MESEVKSYPNGLRRVAGDVSVHALMKAMSREWRDEVKVSLGCLTAPKALKNIAKGSNPGEPSSEAIRPEKGKRSIAYGRKGYRLEAYTTLRRRASRRSAER